MFTQRATAYKTTARQVLASEFVSKEGETSYIMLDGKQASRIRLLGTIVNKFTNDERKSGNILLDDGSEVISIRGWENEYDMISKASVGMLVDIVGRVRNYNDDNYVIPEIIKEVSPNWLVLRKLEMGGKKQAVSEEIKNEETPKAAVSEDLKNKIFQKIKDKASEGATMEELTLIAGDKNKCIEVLRALIEEDQIFEPRAGRYKAL